MSMGLGALLIEDHDCTVEHGGGSNHLAGRKDRKSGLST
jgi:hypothetical protein